MSSYENTQDKKEEKMKEQSQVILYRDNDLFRDYIPLIVDTLKSMGRKVEVVFFPKEATKEDIKKWAEENPEKLQDKEIIADFTTSYAVEKIKNKGYLDKLFDKASKELLLGKGGERLTNEENWKEYKNIPLEEMGVAFMKVVRRIIENQENMPNMIGIWKDKISDHQPFHISYEKKVEEDGEQEEIVKQEIISILKDWFVQAGISQKLVKEIKYDDLENFDKKGNWIIVDRHAKRSFENIKNAMVLQLPLANFLSSTEEQGLIKFKENELKDLIKQQVEKDFVKF